MKSTTSVINGILAVAIIVLFVLHFNNKSTPSIPASVKNGSGQIAYFEIDSIQNNYEFFKEVKAALQSKVQQHSTSLAYLKNEYDAKFQDLQKDSQTLTPAEVEIRRQELLKLGKNYAEKEQQLAEEMQEESNKRMQEIKKKVEEYLAVYNKDKKFAYIISNNPDLIFYKDTANDITADIIKGLNEAYKNKK
jgi:outer membrane protein